MPACAGVEQGRPVRRGRASGETVPCVAGSRRRGADAGPARSGDAWHGPLGSRCARASHVMPYWEDVGNSVTESPPRLATQTWLPPAAAAMGPRNWYLGPFSTWTGAPVAASSSVTESASSLVTQTWLPSAATAPGPRNWYLGPFSTRTRAPVAASSSVTEP